MAKVVDSYTILCWMQNEPGSDLIHNLVEKASNGEETLFISVISMTEVYYSLLKNTDEEQANSFFDDLKKRVIPIEIMPITNKRAWKAAQLKNYFSIPFSDAFTAALAAELKATLVTGDAQFYELEQKGVIQIEWLPEIHHIFY
ncbi:MAG: type II toxin-antitoxin system VapC family toxin [Candidatus Syntrophonatronum acetioxidans]|uniref:Type II toxin-antitoxin system VapC family toxin n=1 Tax=Candidatus Syntrophonatronum acetioxidans TaxID=1795816 RepID=A0A424YDI3_9FIRM|nr:MAG: type II toxin-antitoxin system VapC family toxin [Candidatus Syntrophonatronum acetioxidans]